MLWTKFKYENKQRAITQEISKQDSSLHSPLMRSIYQKFHNPSPYTFGDMLRTKFKYEKQQGNNSKNKQARVTISSHCTLPS